MALNIETFSNAGGRGNALYKAVTHPLAAAPARNLIGTLAANGAVAIYDPDNHLAAFDAVFPLDGIEISGLFVQDLADIGRTFRNHAARPVTELPSCRHSSVLIASFDAGPISARLRDLVGEGPVFHSLDALKLEPEMLSDKARYLSNLNFATNFVFFRDEGGHHTRLVTANYWSAYGGNGGFIRFILFGGNGRVAAEWSEPLPAANAAIVVDSAEVRQRFSLPPFTGQLFVHVVGAAGHDIVKYALDTYGDGPEILSCTHDANSWPSNRYAGLPAPGEGDEVVLWVQNSHPVPIPAGDIGLNLMGDEHIAYLREPIGAFATRRLSVSELLPRARFPQQIEVRAGKHMVRPRYEVARGNGRLCIAHPNVEREDLKPDAQLPKLGDLLGKGFILPAPVLPPERYRSIVMPTPMSTAQTHLPLTLTVYDAGGRKAGERKLGNLKRRESVAFAAEELLETYISGGYGHMELTYDFDSGDEADGWLHALFRYEDRQTGHGAETSFGAHVFNTLVTYKGEPQSYKGPPPGLTTRLFLRVGQAPLDTLCHLIYPASLPWYETSDTALILISGAGKEIARRQLNIPCGGSYLWRFNEAFSEIERNAAGGNCYVIVRDTTCRLFGYHGLLGSHAFSLDHMFGF
jgi:hypothetical protein